VSNADGAQDGLRLAREAEPDDQGWFSGGARYWLDIYQSAGLDAEIYRRRLTRSIAWIDQLGLPDGYAALDAGCGAGDLSIALADRGATVTATDLSTAMTGITHDRLSATSAPGWVLHADAHHLPFPDGVFNLVAALGLLPWVRSPAQVVSELARVTQAGGHVVLSFDNAHRLFRLTDPKFSPLTLPLRRLVRQGRSRPLGGNRLVTPAQARDLVASSSLHVTRTAAIGFGPPTFLGHARGAEARIKSVDARLQRLADSRPSLSRLGAHYLLLARR